MNPILEAFDQGYDENEILNFISKAIPKMMPQIFKAKSAGYTIKEILGFLAKSSGRIESKGLSESEIHARNAKINADMAKRGLGIVAGAALSPLAGMAARSAIARALPSSLTQPSGIGAPNTTSSSQSQSVPSQTAIQPTGIQPQAQQAISSQQPPVSPTTIPQAPAAAQPEQIISNVSDILTKSGLKKHVDELSKRNKKPEEIAAILYSRFPKEMKQLQEEAKKPMEEAIADYVGNVPQETAKEVVEPEKPKEIAKNETVASPQGIGEVKEIRNGQALIDVDGKLHKVSEDELEKEPEDVIETVQQLLQIPEVDRSSIVSLFTYDPADKEMYIQFHNGETYKYLDVDPEKVYKIANKMGIPVTEGKNIFGAWSPEDKKSLGATLIKEIIADPKYKKTKKGEEPNPNYRQLETLYDYWEKLRKKPKRKRL